MAKTKVLPEPRHLVPEEKNAKGVHVPEPRKLVPSSKDKGPLPKKPLHYLPEAHKKRGLVPG